MSMVKIRFKTKLMRLLAIG